jgi:hypothetical protein
MKFFDKGKKTTIKQNNEDQLLSPLPAELIIKILQLLDIKSLIKLISVSKKFKPYVITTLTSTNNSLDYSNQIKQYLYPLLKAAEKYEAIEYYKLNLQADLQENIDLLARPINDPAWLDFRRNVSPKLEIDFTKPSFVEEKTFFIYFASLAGLLLSGLFIMGFGLYYENLLARNTGFALMFLSMTIQLIYDVLYKIHEFRYDEYPKKQLRKHLTDTEKPFVDYIAQLNIALSKHSQKSLLDWYRLLINPEAELTRINKYLDNYHIYLENILKNEKSQSHGNRLRKRLLLK